MIRPGFLGLIFFGFSFSLVTGLKTAGIGENVTFECTSENKWFFCLWRTPDGGKVCAINETGSYSTVCSGSQGMSISGDSTSCRLSINNLSTVHTGTFICLLNQAETFVTSRASFDLLVAQPANLYIGVHNQLYTNLSSIDVVEGESIDVQCTAKDGVPSAAVYWQYPGEKLKEVGSGSPSSTLRYSGRVEDDGEILVCSAGQLDDSNLPLYSTQINTIIRIIQPSPLSSSVASSINIIILIISIIIVLIFIIVFVIIFAVVKQKKKKGERRSIDQSTWTSNTPSRCAVHPLHSAQCEDKYKVCSAEIHSSSSSNSSADTSTDTNTSLDTEKSIGEVEDNVSFSPTFKYTGYQSFNKYDNVVESSEINGSTKEEFKPKRLGHFDPSVNVHDVTRPNTGNSSLYTAGSRRNSSKEINRRLKRNSLETAEETAENLEQILGVARIHLGCRGRVYPAQQVTNKPVLQPINPSNLPPIDIEDGRATASVFDCQLGCFSPDHQHTESKNCG
ncbi:uncharacterized protein LOC111702549 [Eurytemora carolleeae]|uniref:uncharacterized protein LOC111702549 n=1 Tax=Eurytemora carolleeae TaxID=1294199 RepID=UPI000C771330|nr:uncharacterized protein LOC111702549 [Eurytemora carolleeae]|eukprot:XP_023330047.1 uncharacterized protein LOC111702549 [Eurytemora affinis]